MADFGIVLLAAGASTRLGQPKQLLPYSGQSLLCHAALAAVQALPAATVVVLGARAEPAAAALAGLPVTAIHNPDWATGMASSIRCGLTALLNIIPVTGGVIFMVCDQPFVSSAHLQHLAAMHGETGKDIIASFYGGGPGVPAFFSPHFFAGLLHLEGAEGAKKIIGAHPASVATVPFPDGAVDIDTLQDYEALLRGRAGS